MSDVIVGIDLGTTNSEVAALHEGEVRILAHDGNPMLPSCVGLAPEGSLLVGRPARNQELLYPDRTVRAIKRRMGDPGPVRLGDRTLSPPEISALIVRELRQWAQQALGAEVERAIITVPAYFSDAQRQATREAGELAGLEVVRLINEPTAASLAYGHDGQAEQTAMVYDLGGGTFDVAVVNVGEEVTEVLASHGNNRLGGDDFDALIVDRLIDVFHREHGVDLRREEHGSARLRLRAAAEAAKRRLSAEPFVLVREEALIVDGGRPLHLQHELSRTDYEAMIRPHVESTMESVTRALSDSGKSPSDIDVVLLVGGSARTPLVSELLEERLGTVPRQDVHPDLCVALGAALLGSRTAGHDVKRILVDVSPYTFGVSHLGWKRGMPHPHCFQPIIKRNTPLPVTRTELFQTAHQDQTEVLVEVYQGDDDDALNNVHVGSFHIEGLTPSLESNEVMCRMKLDLNGLLEVTAIEKQTNLSKRVTIDGAGAPRDAEEMAARHRDVEAMYATRDARATDDGVGDGTVDPTAEIGPASLRLVGCGPDALSDERRAEASGDGLEADPSGGDRAFATVAIEANGLVGRCRDVLTGLHVDDRAEAVDLNEAIEIAIQSEDLEGLSTAAGALREFLFFVEGR